MSSTRPGRPMWVNSESSSRMTFASMRAINDSTVLYPSDANATAALVKEMADQPGICYLRTIKEVAIKPRL